MAKRTQSPALQSLKALFDGDPGRLERLSMDVAGIHFDWSKTHLDQEAIATFTARLAECGFEKARGAMFAGAVVNSSEDRPATHVFERGSGTGEEAEIAAARRQRMRALVDAVEAGAFGDVTGILHIGIGGSLLGPHLLVDALGRGRGSFTARFVGNIDGAAFDDAIRPLDPATTLIVAVSKTFTTAETLANLDSALDWLRGAGVADP